MSTTSYFEQVTLNDKDFWKINIFKLKEFYKQYNMLTEIMYGNISKSLKAKDRHN